MCLTVMGANMVPVDDNRPQPGPVRITFTIIITVTGRWGEGGDGLVTTLTIITTKHRVRVLQHTANVMQT